jgi:Family of unknown function (DUF6069)
MQSHLTSKDQGMTTMTADNTTGSASVGFGKLVGRALLGGAIAAVVNVVLFFGAKAGGVPMTGEFQPGAVTELMLPAVAISIVPGFFGAIVALLFQKFTRQAARNFAILAGVFTVFSLGGPANVKQISTGTIVVMELMHVVAAVGIGGALYRALKR